MHKLNVVPSLFGQTRGTNVRPTSLPTLEYNDNKECSRKHVRKIPSFCRMNNYL